LGAGVKVGREFSPLTLVLGSKEEQNQPLQYFFLMRRCLTYLRISIGNVKPDNKKIIQGECE
jgi:hypothetical protein